MITAYWYVSKRIECDGHSKDDVARDNDCGSWFELKYVIWCRVASKARSGPRMQPPSACAAGSRWAASPPPGCTAAEAPRDSPHTADRALRWAATAAAAPRPASRAPPRATLQGPPRPAVSITGGRRQAQPPVPKRILANRNHISQGAAPGKPPLDG